MHTGRGVVVVLPGNNRGWVGRAAQTVVFSMEGLLGVVETGCCVWANTER